MKSLLLVGTLLIGSLAGASDQPKIANAKVEQRSVAGSLAQQVTSISGPAWIGYSEPVIDGNHNMCCYNWNDKSRGANCCGGCGLEKDHGSFEGRNGDCQQLEPSKSFMVMMRVSKGKVEKVRMFSTTCAVDGGGMTVYWLNDVRAADSISFLTGLAEHGMARGEDESADGAIAAIAMHADPAADGALGKLMSSGDSEKAVEQATFWAGVARGSKGYELIATELDRNNDTEFRKHAVFALSQNSDERAQKKIIDMARHDSNSEIRGESLFWLSQEAGKKAAGVISSAIEDDPNTDVKKKAVFSLSQLPEEEGVPLLIEQAKKNANPVVRKEAIFWLGQSNDPRALDYITSVLVK